MLSIKGKSDKLCVICKKPDTRLAVDTKEEFSGPLCKEHLWEMTNSPMAPKKNKAGGEKSKQKGESS